MVGPGEAEDDGGDRDQAGDEDPRDGGGQYGRLWLQGGHQGRGGGQSDVWVELWLQRMLSKIRNWNNSG